MPYSLARATALLSIVSCACASAPATRASPAPTAGVALQPTRRGDDQNLAPPQGTAASAPDVGGNFQSGAGAAAADPVIHWLSVIDQDSNALAAGLSECRQICAAAANICTASREICRLTDASDARCARARAACADAGQRRDTSCAVCPP